MREVLDCGVLIMPVHDDWMRDWIRAHGQRLGRIRLHPVAFDAGAMVVAVGGRADAYAGQQAAVRALVKLAVPLRRYDACVLPVDPTTLGWARTALACARAELHTPMLGVARDLKAAAVQDLLGLGLRDFVREPVCSEELRARLGRLATQAAMPDKWAAAGSSGRPDPRAPVDHGEAPVLREPPNVYPLPGRRRLARAAIDTAVLSIQSASRLYPEESFRTAKSRVVSTFERDYVRTALSRHCGNVARAARASDKHRRAFWALMRKHQIDATPYRARGEPGVDQASEAGG